MDHLEVRDDLELVVLPELHDLAAKVEVRHLGLALEPLTSEGGLHGALDDAQDGVVFVGVAIRGHHGVLEQRQGDRALEVRGGVKVQVLVLLPQEVPDRLLDLLDPDREVVVMRRLNFMLLC